jgi:hypothetical protein
MRNRSAVRVHIAPRNDIPIRAYRFDATVSRDSGGFFAKYRLIPWNTASASLV